MLRAVLAHLLRGQFLRPDSKTVDVDLPHTWNNIDGQDGGNDYWRGTCTYKTRFAAPAFDAETQQVWLQFEGVNASAKVVLNGHEVMTHDGGYSTFRADITAFQVSFPFWMKSWKRPFSFGSARDKCRFFSKGSAE